MPLKTASFDRNRRLTLKPLVVAAIGLVLATSIGPAVAAPKNMFNNPDDKVAPENAGRDALRQIVQTLCITNWTQLHVVKPCERLVLANEQDTSSGYAILADKKGGAHYLAIPTRTMHGVDAEELLDPDAYNYFGAAWTNRDVLAKFVGHPVPRTAVGLAVNNAHSRSQDQYHIHIECLRQDVVDALHAAAENVTTTWGPINVIGSTYQALRVESMNLDNTNPYALIAKLGPEVRHHIGDYTVVVAGMQYANGAGIIVLTGTGATGELLLDSSCAAAGAGG